MENKSPENKGAKPPENKNGPAVPDFAAAAALIRDEVATAATKASKANGEKSGAWKRVQDSFHVNKSAAKVAANLAGMSDELQSDWLRSFFGLMPHLNIGVRRDLVDMAEGDAPTFKVPVKDAPESPLE